MLGLRKLRALRLSSRRRGLCNRKQRIRIIDKILQEPFDSATPLIVRHQPNTDPRTVLYDGVNKSTGWYRIRQIESEFSEPSAYRTPSISGFHVRVQHKPHGPTIADWDGSPDCVKYCLYVACRRDLRNVRSEIIGQASRNRTVDSMPKQEVSDDVDIVRALNVQA